ncbi:MAG TPA: choice-of-anchor Q domain-containing protein [Candidatus Acidoferrum sp.]|nr:choice-of-anchor Q domain-containing protein [Candidatus Acidoferrum sp.]
MALTASLLAVSYLSAAMHYVNINNTDPAPPYTTWATAATNIQDAVNVAATNDVVVVTNGVYPGGVTVTNPLTLLSVNGPQFTVIDGGGSNQCISLPDGASLSGFTVTNGGMINENGSGGGVWCASTNAFLTNCVIANNSGIGPGGGVHAGTLYNCTLTGNFAFGGGGGGSGGGAAYSTLYNCILSSNVAAGLGNKDAYGSPGAGGGAFICTLFNCTLVENVAASIGKPPQLSIGSGGGACGSTLYNCIVYFNNLGSVITAEMNYDSSCTLDYCCTTPLPTNGIGNISVPPLFVDYAGGNLRLQSNSPCINAGNNAYVATATDLDGRPRIVDGTVDMGAYEFQPGAPGAFIGWLQQYGLPTDGSVDNADLDGTGFSVYQDWIAGLNPTNALSVLKMLVPVKTNNPAGLVVTWQSVNTRMYYLQRSTNLAAQPAFSTIQSNIVGQAGTTSYTDTTATNAGPNFYRVGVGQ